MVFSHLESDHGMLHVTFYESDLKREGILELNLSNPADLLKVKANDTVDIEDLDAFAPGKPCVITLHHADDTTETVPASCTFNSGA
jgi:aconitase A